MKVFQALRFITGRGNNKHVFINEGLIIRGFK